MRGRRNTPEDFWAKVDIKGSGDCWPWRLSKRSNGYGQTNWEGRNRTAHAVAYELHHGVKLPQRYRGNERNAVLVLHSCDFRPCCNPAHLWLGTHKANWLDCIAKGRTNYAIGDRSPSRKYPERLARGDRHRSRTHPESVARGLDHWNVVLTPRKVRAIRRRLAKGEVRRVIAADYGVSRSCVQRIAEGKGWRHVR